MKSLEGMTGQTKAIVSSGGVPGFLDDLGTPKSYHHCRGGVRLTLRCQR